MTVRGVSLKLLRSDWLTLDVVSEAMNQIDTEKEYVYDVHFTMSIILHNFIGAAKSLNNEEMADILEYSANAYHESLDKKSSRMITITDDQWMWLLSRANKLNKNYEEAYFSIDTIVTSAILDYRLSHFKVESSEIAGQLLAHIQKKDKKEYLPVTLFKHDIEVLQFVAECTTYFCKPRAIVLNDVVSYALDFWLKKYVNKATVSLYLSLEDTSKRFQRYRGRQLFGFRFGDYDKTKTHYMVKKSVFHSLFHVVGLIQDLDQVVYPVDPSVICTDAIRELKKEFLYSPILTTLKDLNRRRFTIFR